MYFMKPLDAPRAEAAEAPLAGAVEAARAQPAEGRQQRLMHLTSQDEFADMSIVRTLGLVKGGVVRARFFVRDIVAGFRMMVGGEVPEYTKLLAEAREQALDRMIAQAEALGADGVVAVRFTTSQIVSTAAEILVTGTAVTLRPRSDD